MATAREYAQWIVDNKDKRGTPEFETVSRAFQVAKQRESQRKAAAEEVYDPTDGMSGGQRFLAGVGRGMTNIARNVGNLVGLVDDQAIRDANERDKDLLRTRGGMLGNIVGEAAATAPLTLGVGTGFGAIRGAGTAARVITNPITRGVAEGAAQGFVSAGPDNRAGGAITGGIAGGVFPAASAAVRGAARGFPRTPEAQFLVDRGVSLTPGQMNPTSAVNQIEETLQSAPLVGSVIRNARENAQAQFNRAVVEQSSLSPLSAAASTLDAQLDEAFRAFNSGYAPARGIPVTLQLAGAGGNRRTLEQALKSVTDKARTGLTPDIRKNEFRVLSNTLQEVVDAANQRGGLQSDDLLDFRTLIRDRVRSLPQANSTDLALREMYEEAEDVVTQALNNQLPRAAMTAVRAADAKYAQYKTVAAAVRKAGDRPTGFTATNLSNAVRENTPPDLYARGGGGALREFAKAGAQAFEMRAPPTGARIAILGGGAYQPYVGVPVAAGMLAAAGTQTGRRFAAGQLAGQAQLDRLLQSTMTNLSPAQRALIARYGRGLLTSAAVPEEP